MFLLKIWIMLCFSSMCLLCFRFMFFFIFSVMFLLKIGLRLVFLRFCYDCYVDLFSVVFLFYVSILLCNDFLFYMYYVEFGLFSSVFLLGFCLYVLWQHQICSSIWQSLEFAKSVGFWVGKSATSVPSLSRKNILDKYWPVPLQNTGQ